MDDVVQNLRRIELNEIHCNEPAYEYYGYIKGSIPVLISAPHGAKHFRTREKRWKIEDAYTSALAVELGRLTGAHVLFVRNKAGEDPNNDVHTRYKDFLKEIVAENDIKFVMDLHGAAGNKPFKIDVGTMDNKIEKSSCPTYGPIIREALRDFQVGGFNKTFFARSPATITHFARRELGVEAAQFEINARYRVVESRRDPSIKADPKDILELVERLQAVIIGIEQAID